MKTQKEPKEKENKTGDKMIIRLKEETVKEIFKNNLKCSLNFYFIK